MVLLTKEARRSLPALYSTEQVADPIAQVKFFTPDSNWTWYATEGNAIDEEGNLLPIEQEVVVPGLGVRPPVDDFRFFGLVQGHEEELGYFQLRELLKARGPLGLRIERDRAFRPTPLSKLRLRPITSNDVTVTPPSEDDLAIAAFEGEGGAADA